MDEQQIQWHIEVCLMELQHLEDENEISATEDEISHLKSLLREK